MARVPPLLAALRERLRPALVWLALQVDALRGPKRGQSPMSVPPPRRAPKPGTLPAPYEPTPRSPWLARAELIFLCSFALAAALDRTAQSHAGARAGFVVLGAVLLTLATFRRGQAMLLRRACFAAVLLLLPGAVSTSVLAAALATSLASFTIVDALAGLRGLPGLAPHVALPVHALRAAPYTYSVVAAACAAWALRTPIPSAAATSLLVTWIALAILGCVAFAIYLAKARSLELGAPPRAWAAALAFVPCSVAAAFAVFVGHVAPLSAVSAAFVVASSIGALVAQSFDALRGVRRARQLGTLAAFGTPVCLFLALIAADEASQRPAVTLVAFVVGAAMALWHGRLAELAGSGRSPWAPFLAEAQGVSERRHPFDAVTRALERVQHAPSLGTAPVLVVFETGERIDVDRAGYLRRRPVAYPAELITAALAEPFTTVREEVLHALEVRRPDLRALLAWLDADDIVAACVGIADAEPVCAMLLPRGTRETPLSLEELFEAKRLADVLAGHLAILGERRQSGALVDRLEKRLSAEDDAARLIAHRAARRGNARRRETERLASQLLPVLIAPKSRLVQEALERAAARNQGCFVLTAAGNDGIAALARAHLAGARQDEAFVVVDCTAVQTLDRFQSSAHSPLLAADRGALVLQDVRALPLAVQRFVAHVHAEKRLPDGDAEPLDFVLTLTARESATRLLDTGELAPELYARLGGATPLTLPEIADRPEDLRALLVAKLAREGMRAHGRPIGIADAAFAVLVESTFLGGEAELDALCVALCRVASSGVVQLEDLALARPRPATPLEPENSSASVTAKPVSRPPAAKSVATKRRSTRQRR